MKLIIKQEYSIDEVTDGEIINIHTGYLSLFSGHYDPSDPNSIIKVLEEAIKVEYDQLSLTGIRKGRIYCELRREDSTIIDTIDLEDLEVTSTVINKFYQV